MGKDDRGQECSAPSELRVIWFRRHEVTTLRCHLFQEVEGSRQRSGVKLISDLRLLTSVIDDFDDLPFTASPILPQDLNVPILLCNDFIQPLQGIGILDEGLKHLVEKNGIFLELNG